MESVQLGQGLLFFVVLVIALSFHEFSHAFSAWKLGDSTAFDAGRVSLNPMNHLDPMGTVMLVFLALGGIGLGWAKPVPVNPFNLKNPRRDLMLVSLAGPVSNLIQAIVGVLLFTLMVRSGISFSASIGNLIQDFFRFFVLVNVSLFVFNMLPVYPLDGSKIISWFMPKEMGVRFDLFMARAGMMPLVVLIVAEMISNGKGPLSWVLFPLINMCIRILPGDVGLLFS